MQLKLTIWVEKKNKLKNSDSELLQAENITENWKLIIENDLWIDFEYDGIFHTNTTCF